jgi:hypothetical protein
MFITNVIANNTILERTLFYNIKQASNYALEKSREKVWKLSDTSVYYGNVESRVYEINIEESSDHKDEHILSFLGSM